MKAKYILMAGLAALAVFSCSKRDEIPPEPEPPVNPLPPAKVVSTTHDGAYKMTVCAIEYPSVDPDGNPATLSAIITYGDEINEKSPARGIVLMNRFTAAGLADSPSGGCLYGAQLLAGSRLVCISPDLYGFGSTKDKMQAYCLGNTNAQASIDALLAAQELLEGMGIPFEPGKMNRIFNIGYSQGGQTAIGVLKLAAEKYPDIHFTHTFAGSGPYDMFETFRSLSRPEEVSHHPASVILSLVAYNEYYHLGYTLEDLFQPSAIEPIEKYILSKEYTRMQLYEYFPAQRMNQFVNSDFFNMDSEISKRFTEVFRKENFCTGWVPRKEDRILLFSNPDDEIVAPYNTQSLYHFLVDHQDLPHVQWVSSSGVSFLFPERVPRHAAAALDYGLKCVSVLAINYEIAWLPNIVQIVEDVLANMGKE